MNPVNDTTYKKVIATGYHLEWLAIAPAELHPPRGQILKAADRLIKNTTERSKEDVRKHYTFHSHVGNALALVAGDPPGRVLKKGDNPSYFWKKSFGPLTV